jgi:hypothetical protein
LGVFARAHAYTQTIEFLHRHLKIDPSQPNNTHVYAMKRDPGIGLFVPELQSTLYYRKLFEDQIDISTGTLANIDDPTNQFRSGIATFYAISTINGCLSRCAIDAVQRTVALKSVRFNAVDQSCFCFDTSFFQWRADGYPTTDVDSLWIRDTGSASQWFETEYCEFVRADTVRAHTQSNPKPPLLHATSNLAFPFALHAARAHDRVDQEHIVAWRERVLPWLARRRRLHPVVRLVVRILPRGSELGAV